jgi:predicted Rossmann fold flavoprotein
VCLDGAERLGAKILIAGGGRCNVTHDVVDERAFAGSSPNAVRKVLRRFDVRETIAFFAACGVTLKREDTGSSSRRPIAHAPCSTRSSAPPERPGVALRHPWRVETIALSGERFVVAGPAGTIAARHVVLATGGRSVPKTGSDGHGYVIARSLGHSVTTTFPALVPLTLPDGHFLRALSGVGADVTLVLRSASGEAATCALGLASVHAQGLSGPVVLDMSRHWRAALAEDPTMQLVVDWLPALRPEQVDELLLAPGSAGAVRRLHAHLPERLARALCEHAGVDGSAPAPALPRIARRALVDARPRSSYRSRATAGSRTRRSRRAACR